MSRIVLESKAPTWQKADLRMTRVKDTDRGELLIFKELSWQTVRIEAKSTMSEDLTPLRLITNQARCRITIKKKLSGMWAMHYLVVSLLGFEFQVWLGIRDWCKKTELTQELTINKKFLFSLWSSWYSSNITYLWAKHFDKVSLQ